MSGGTERDDAATGPSSTAPSSSTASRRTVALAVALTVTSLAVLVQFGFVTRSAADPMLSWWMIAVVAITAEMMVFDVEFRREVYTFTFSEVVLVLGLLLADPIHLVIGRFVGEAMFLIVRERQMPRKLALNLSTFLAETTVLLSIHRMLGAPTDVADPRTWLVGLVSVAVADFVGFVLVFQVVRWHGAPIALRSILTIGLLTVPVNTSFGLVVAILLDHQPWATLLLGGVAAFLVLAYRSYAALRQRFKSLTLLYEFTRLVSGAQRPDAILEAMLTQAKDLLRAERAELWVYEDESTLLRIRVSDEGRSGGVLDGAAAAMIEPWFQSNPGATAIDRSDRDVRAVSMARLLEAHDCIVAPITESGRIVGLVAVANRLGEVNHFGDGDCTMFATLANHASVALENGRLIDRLHVEADERQHQALHDALTGLPNRVFFGERLRAELVASVAGGTAIAVGLLDLDGFKEINDTLGHQVGDDVLAEVARRLRLGIDADVHVARLGGDEFALLLPRVSDRSDVEAAGRAIREEISRPIMVDGLRIHVTASIGFALSPDDALDGPTLLQRADVAMYRAKSGMGNGVSFYEATTDDNSPRRLELASGLRGAISEGQLSLLYQPKARLDTGEVVGFEALVRWLHPELGLLMPDEFIPLAERAGSISELTQYVMRVAFQQAGAWRAAGRSWSVAVNVSTRNLLDDNFVESVAVLLAETGCEPSRVTFEITETSMMSDTKRTIDIMESLADLGIRLSVDDFGTGYSSLMYLQQLPVEEIKIDKLFVRHMRDDPNAEAIVRSVLDLARNLDLHVVGEGVEDRYLWDRLGQLGCTIGQGYFLARPMAGADIDQWVETWDATSAADRNRTLVGVARSVA